jgi:DNA repair exonuclease SbcCD ATPase subunit
MDVTSATATSIILAGAIAAVGNAFATIIKAYREPAKEAERDQKAEALHADTKADLAAAVKQSVAATTKVDTKLEQAHQDLVTRQVQVDDTLGKIKEQTNGNLDTLQRQLNAALERIGHLEQMLQQAVAERRVRRVPPATVVYRRRASDRPLKARRRT